MKVAVIDNIDSFVYNIVQYIGKYGGSPLIFSNNSKLTEIKKAEPDKIIISPGPKTPKEAGISSKVVRELSKDIPTLGVCLGHQVIAYTFGGNVTVSKQLMHGKTSPIEHNGKTIYSEVPNPFQATRYHSLIVDRPSLPSCFQITATAKDKHGEIMGIEHEKYPIFGIQYHPESILTPHGERILENFLNGVNS